MRGAGQARWPATLLERANGAAASPLPPPPLPRRAQRCFEGAGRTQCWRCDCVATQGAGGRHRATGPQDGPRVLLRADAPPSYRARTAVGQTATGITHRARAAGLDEENGATGWRRPGRSARARTARRSPPFPPPPTRPARAAWFRVRAGRRCAKRRRTRSPSCGSASRGRGSGSLATRPARARVAQWFVP